jgi:hypothetical protein
MIPHPGPQEGRFAVVTKRGLGCDGRCGVRYAQARRTKTPAAYGEVVWSWRRDPGVKPRGKSHAGDGGKRGRSPGRARISRKAIARGRPGCLGCTCQTRVRSLLSLHTVLRVQSAPGLPCALCQREGQRDAKLRRNSRRENAPCCLPVIARSKATKQSSFPREGSWIASLRSQ